MSQLTAERLNDIDRQIPEVRTPGQAFDLANQIMCETTEVYDVVYGDMTCYAHEEEVLTACIYSHKDQPSCISSLASIRRKLNSTNKQIDCLLKNPDLKAMPATFLELPNDARRWKVVANLDQRLRKLVPDLN